MPIRKLPTLLINQIAAGEVIERPASVVRELIDNSLDAGAKRIDILIEEGGSRLIRISDDGSGIAADELPLAVAPHATSKLQTPEQLSCITTLGFRGEALASIASVSRVRVTSRVTIDGRPVEAGAMIEAAGDSTGEVMPAATAPGTVIEMRDLFFNTPARRKFLRSDSTEFGHISECVSRIAMIRHDVSFTLTHNNRKTLELIADTGAGGRRRRCVQVLGSELDEALLEFELNDQPRGDEVDAAPAYVWGLAGLPAIARATSKFQYLCLNGRPIRDRNLTHALREAYRGLVPPDQQPVAVVFLHLDPRSVDVNVHPAKSEVRFHEPGRVHGLVLAAMRQRLLGADLTPATKLPQGQRLPIADFRLPIGGGAVNSPDASDDASIGNQQSAIANASTAQAFVDYFRQMAPQQKGFVYEQVRAALANEHPEALRDEPGPGAQQPQLTPQAVRAQSVLQVHQSYLVTQDETGLLIVDQHALHERVMFEELKSRIAGKSLESQRLLMPVILKAGPRRQALLEPLAPLLERIGVEAAVIGPEAVAVHAFPSFLFDRKVDPAEFIEELLDRAQEGEFDGGGDVSEAALHEVLDMMACKAAVKAGDAMSPQELSALLAKREEIERASNCPHGRPTTIRLTLRDLEKQFKRG